MALEQVEPPSGEHDVLAGRTRFAIRFLQFDEPRIEEVAHFCRHRQHEPIFAVSGAIRIYPMVATDPQHGSLTRDPQQFADCRLIAAVQWRKIIGHAVPF